MEDTIGILTAGIVIMSGFSYMAYKRWLDHEIENVRIRSRNLSPDLAQNPDILNLKRQVETLQAIVTSSDYELRRRLQHQLEDNSDASSPKPADESARHLAERPEMQRHSH